MVKGARCQLHTVDLDIVRLKQEPIVGGSTVMPISPLDYRYGRDVAKEIWSREGRHSRLLEVERALIWAHSQMGKVTPEDYDAIAEFFCPIFK